MSVGFKVKHNVVAAEPKKKRKKYPIRCFEMDFHNGAVKTMVRRSTAPSRARQSAALIGGMRAVREIRKITEAQYHAFTQAGTHGRRYAERKS